ncbi:MAG: hypothetical protein Q9187_002457 [Circinaria calcarea]
MAKMLPVQSKEIGKWDEVFSNCLKNRIGFSKFRSLIVETSCKVPISGQACIESLMRQDRPAEIDPRLLVYVQILVQSGQVDIRDVLTCVLQMFKKSSLDETTTERAIACGRQSYEACILQGLAHELSINGRDPDASIRTKFIHILKPLTAWLSYFSMSYDGTNAPSGPALEVADAFGRLLATYINSLSLVGILDGGPPKAFKKSLGRYLPHFVALISRTNVELAQSLDLLQKQAGLYESSNKGHLEDGMLDDTGLNGLTYHESVLDTPAVNTRAAPYILLNAMLAGRPLFDDSAMFDYFNARYNGDIPTLVTDLVTASFDILANAINRTESTESITLIRSFLTNKLPTILDYYSSMIFPPLTTELCISQALNRMDPAAYMSYTQMIDLLGSAGMLADARSEFLFACALHRLIPEQSIEGMLGDVPMQGMPEAGRYVKDELVAQCTAQSGRMDELIGELENMEGNAGEIVGAIVEVIQSLCVTKDTITLKAICDALSRKTQSLDIFLLFIRPSVILQPLCQLVDQWQDHEDQGENHPVYDEFGSIFLLILIIQHHFALQDHDLGIDYQGSFILKFMRGGYLARDPATLSEHENQRLGDWIRGLYETEGISDELMSTCSPKDFHLLVATLFDQSLKACQVGKLGLDTLKGGFESKDLLEPFLLPSLITGLGWFAQRLWETEKAGPELDILLPALQALVKPPSISGDSAALHEAVLSVVSEPLINSLMHILNLQPRPVDIEPLITTLKTHTQPRRSDASSHTDLETWSATPGGGILAAIRHTINSLVQWSQIDSPNATLPSYTHRQLVAAVQMLGAKSVLEALVDEIVKSQAAGPTDVLLDIITTLITAPTAVDFPPTNGVGPTHPKSRLSLRDALSTASDDAYTLSKTNTSRAEITVRLHRRVEAQLARTGSQTTIVTDADAENAMLLDLGNRTAAAAEETLATDVAGMPQEQLDNVVAEVMDDIFAEGGGGRKGGRTGEEDGFMDI